MNFKPGDRVKCINTDGLVDWAEDAVRECNEFVVKELAFSNLVLGNKLLGRDTCWDASRFVLLSKHKYNHKKFNKLLEDL